jgi:hypothetical protein
MPLIWFAVSSNVRVGLLKTAFAPGTVDVTTAFEAPKTWTVAVAPGASTSECRSTLIFAAAAGLDVGDGNGEGSAVCASARPGNANRTHSAAKTSRRARAVN